MSNDIRHKSFADLRNKVYGDPDRSAEGATQPNDRILQPSGKHRHEKPEEYFSDHVKPVPPKDFATEGDQVQKPGISKRVRPNW